MTYLVTFCCYGTHLHGDARGSWSNGAAHEPHPGFRNAMQKLMVQAPYELTVKERPLVLKALIDISESRAWGLIAAHVRSTHVHLVLGCDTTDRVISACKAAATQALNLADGDVSRRRWSRGGSTRSLPTPKAVTAAVHYVVDGQGDRMSVFPA